MIIILLFCDPFVSQCISLANVEEEILVDQQV
jgi:hypothetical protein